MGHLVCCLFYQVAPLCRPQGFTVSTNLTWIFGYRGCCYEVTTCTSVQIATVRVTRMDDFIFYFLALSWKHYTHSRKNSENGSWPRRHTLRRWASTSRHPGVWRWGEKTSILSTSEPHFKYVNSLLFHQNCSQMLTKVHRFHFACCWSQLTYKIFRRRISKLANWHYFQTLFFDLGQTYFEFWGTNLNI
jgi:hypothetical protein